MLKVSFAQNFGVSTEYTGGADLKLRTALAEDIDWLIYSGSIYNEARFATVSLSPDTVNLLHQNPSGGELVRLDRMLLMDAFRMLFPLYRGATKNDAALRFLVGLLLAKLLATLATVGLGAVGGDLHPDFIFGSSLGGDVWLTLQMLGGELGCRFAPFAVVGYGEHAGGDYGLGNAGAYHGF